MKAFKVLTTEVLHGLSWKKEPYPHVPVGEAGRGRELVRFPVSVRFAESLDGRIERASVLKTKDKGDLLLVEERNPIDKRALVHLAVEAGFRGGAAWTAANAINRPCQNKGKKVFGDTKILNGKYVCKYCHSELIELEDSWYYQHPDDGVVEEYPIIDDGVKGVKILAKGYCAQGDAGRKGGHPEYLVILEPYTLIRVHRMGRLYGRPAVQYLYWDGEDLKFGAYDEIFPPSDGSEDGELI